MEQTLNCLLQNSQELIIMVNKEGDYTYVSPGVKKKLGYHIDEIPKQIPFNFMPPESISLLGKIIAKSYNEPGRPVPFSDLTVYHKDGSARILKGTLTNMLDIREVQGVVVNAFDITEFKEMENEIGKRENSLKTVIENAVDGFLNNIDSSIYICHMKTYKILFMNKFMKELFGKDLTGAVCWKSFHENRDGPCKFCSNDKLLDAEGNPAEPFVWEFYNKKLKKHFELHDLAIPWIDNSYARMEIAIDISRQKQAELKQKKINKILENKVEQRRTELEDMNAALKVLLQNREEDQREIEARIFSNYKMVIIPFINKLRTGLTQKNQQYLVNILESELQNILSPFSKHLADPLTKLSPAETVIADLVKNGKSNKQIAEILNNSIHTIARHRENIRKKFGLQKRKINLRRFLSTIR